MRHSVPVTGDIFAHTPKRGRLNSLPFRPVLSRDPEKPKAIVTIFSPHFESRVMKVILAPYPYIAPYIPMNRGMVRMLMSEVMRIAPAMAA